jgi:hypothetical protein
LLSLYTLHALAHASLPVLVILAARWSATPILKSVLALVAVCGRDNAHSRPERALEALRILCGRERRPLRLPPARPGVGGLPPPG